MPSSLNITATALEPELLALPWSSPLVEWPDDVTTTLPKGISRHVVRFVQFGDHVIAVKETTAEMAAAEYSLLRDLRRLKVPCVKPLAVITNRHDVTGDQLSAALVTRHLKFSIPFRALYQTTLRPETAKRLIDALALLLVRLHSTGFFWGDVSLSNTLFRRDAGSFAAYLVDAETGRLYSHKLSDGQRAHDLDIARTNIAGELMDLRASGRIDPSLDPVTVADRILETYEGLWHELNDPELVDEKELWRINKRVERLNSLGFDIGELDIQTTDTGTTVRIQPKVVDAGHHARRLLRLTGLDTEENQARRLLNDLDRYAATVQMDGLDEEMKAHLWLTRVYEPVIRAIPHEFESKLEPAEMFHQVLEHRWYMCENQNRDIPLNEAVRDYIDSVLKFRPDEDVVMVPPTTSITMPVDVVDENAFGWGDPQPPPRDADEPERDWRDLV